MSCIISNIFGWDNEIPTPCPTTVQPTPCSTTIKPTHSPTHAPSVAPTHAPTHSVTKKSKLRVLFSNNELEYFED